MGRKPVKDKKLPSEYPQIAFRVSEADKRRLSAKIEEIQTVLNKKRSEEEPFVNKNDVFVRALDEGLKVLKKS